MRAYARVVCVYALCTCVHAHVGLRVCARAYAYLRVRVVCVCCVYLFVRAHARVCMRILHSTNTQRKISSSETVQEEML